MAEYQVRLMSRTGTRGPVLKVIPAYERGLGNTGKCQFTVDLNNPALTWANTEPWANEVLLLRRESTATAWDSATVVHDGPIVDAEADVDAGTMSITAEPLSAWLDKRNQRRTVAVSYGTATDLDTIAGALVFLAQHPEPPYNFDAAADLAVSNATNATGTTRTYSLPTSARRNWLEVLNELAGGNPGFDWDILTTWNGTTRTRTFRTYSPSRGSVSGTPLVLGRGLVGLTVRRDGKRAANYVESFGDNGTILVSSPTQDGSSQSTYGLVEFMDTSSGLSTTALVNDRATEQLRIRKPPAQLISAGYSTASLPFRFATIGDTVTVRASRGPVNLSGQYRAIYEKVTVTRGGLEQVDFTFQDPL